MILSWLLRKLRLLILDTDHQILSQLNRTPTLRAHELVTASSGGLDRKHIVEELESLEQEGLIVKTCDGFNTYWRITELGRRKLNNTG